MSKYRRSRSSKKRSFHARAPKRSVRLRTPEQIARDATRPVHIKIPGYRYVNGRYVSSVESLLHRAMNPPPLRFPGTPMQFRRQEPGW